MTGSRQRRLRPRRLLFAAVLVVLLLAAAEGAARLASLLAGGAAGSELAALRRAVAAEEDAAAVTAAADEAAAVRRLRRLRRGWRHHVLHPFLGFVADPGHRPGGDPVARELGFPGNSRSLLQPADPGRLVVVVTGGSVAEILVADGGEPLRAGLAAVPRFAGREVVLLSLATGGFKQPQQLMALTWLESLGGHFDLVINLDGFNEVALPPVDLEPRGIFTAYPRDWWVRVADLDPGQRRIRGELAWLRQRRSARAKAFSHPPWSWSRLATLLWRFQDRALEERLEERRESLAAALPSPGGAAGFQTRGPRREVVLGDDATAASVAIWERSSRVLHRLVTAAGGEYHHLLQPNLHVPGTKPLSPAEQRLAAADRDGGVGYHRGVEAAWQGLRRRGQELRRDGVAFSDLTELYRGVETTLYVDSCCHLNGEGNRRLAAAVVAAVAAPP